jgi:hypothetical protein
MSKFNKCGLAAAVLAALALPMAANAATAAYPANTNITFASNLFGDQSVVISNPAPYTITTNASDNIIGRTTGFGVRLILGNGAKFATTTTAPVAGEALIGYLPPTVAALGDSRMVVSVTPDPDAPNQNILTGSLLTFGAGTIDLGSVTALATPGASIPVTIELFDSNTAQVFQTITGAVLATSAEGTTVTFNPSAGDVPKRIDVSTCSGTAKTGFSPDGTIGGSCPASPETSLFDAGAITIGITQVTNNERVLAAGFSGGNNDGGAFGYVVTDPLADTVDVTVTGTDFSAFAEGAGSVFLGDASCGANYGSGEVTSDRATFTAVPMSAFPATPTGGTVHVCFAVGGEELISAQALQASVGINFTDERLIEPGDRTGGLLPLAYNGSVLEFQNFNPASNPRAESFIRLTNNNNTSCPVSLTGKDDNGMSGASAVALTLAPQASVTLNSADVENGSSKATGAFGDGAGRWYLTVDAECTNIVGSALNRNLEDGTVTNLTSDKRDTQAVQQ